MDVPGAVLSYVCATCERRLSAIVLSSGAVPPLLCCVSCGAVMTRARVERGALTISAEFFRPSDEQIATLDALTRDHVARGGLLVRRL